jgi:hypothetical protein
MMNVRSCHQKTQETQGMPTERPSLNRTRSDETELRLSEARRLAHQVEALLVEAAKDPSVDAYALRIAQGLARSLIDQLVERPASSSRLQSHLAKGPSAPDVGRGPAKVA